MERGIVVKIKEQDEYYIFLSQQDGIANCMVVEELLDEYQGDTIVKATSIKKINVDELIVPKRWPRFFNQINVA